MLGNPFNLPDTSSKEDMKVHVPFLHVVRATHVIKLLISGRLPTIEAVHSFLSRIHYPRLYLRDSFAGSIEVCLRALLPRHLLYAAASCWQAEEVKCITRGAEIHCAQTTSIMHKIQFIVHITTKRS
jgi:hypothetical protein